MQEFVAEYSNPPEQLTLEFVSMDQLQKSWLINT